MPVLTHITELIPGTSPVGIESAIASVLVKSTSLRFVSSWLGNGHVYYFSVIFTLVQIFNCSLTLAVVFHFYEAKTS